MNERLCMLLMRLSVTAVVVCLLGMPQNYAMEAISPRGEPEIPASTASFHVQRLGVLCSLQAENKNCPNNPFSITQKYCANATPQELAERINAAYREEDQEIRNTLIAVFIDKLLKDLRNEDAQQQAKRLEYKRFGFDFEIRGALKVEYTRQTAG